MISKDNENVSEKIINTPNPIYSIDSRVFYPNWDNYPPQQQSVIKQGEKHLLSMGGLLTICAKPGVGKSSVVEAFISSVLNKNSDSLGMSISLSKDRGKVLICDTERSEWESHKSWLKLMKRAKIKKGTGVENNIIFANLKALNVDEKRAYIENVLNADKSIGLVVFDGAADFVNNSNDLVETNNFITWINKFDSSISIVCTIHTNPTDDKPRGHFGSELCRRSESVLLLKKIDSNRTLITSDFFDGKNRHDSPINWMYMYSELEDMFVSIEEPITNIKTNILTRSNLKYKEMAKDIWNDKNYLSFAEIINGIMSKTNKEYENSKNIFFKQFKDKICSKIDVNGISQWELLK
jgi:hypothetical protein